LALERAIHQNKIHHLITFLAFKIKDKKEKNEKLYVEIYALIYVKTIS